MTSARSNLRPDKRLAWAGRVAALLLVPMIAGCSTTTARIPVPKAHVSDAAVPKISHARFWGDEVPPNPAKAIKTYLPSLASAPGAQKRNARRRVVNMLAISGGGTDGAFAAGLLAGWEQKGTRPQFHVVTGVSAGAITAPFAFLGPAYDGKLKEIWTQYGKNDLIRPKVLAGLLGGDAVTDTAPLANLIARYVDRQVLLEIAQAYRQGRVLLIGTTNLDAQRPVIWNMGEIAVKGDQDALRLFRRVILASAAIPGAFPPVHIEVRAEGKRYEEMHVDGGATREVFVVPLGLSLRAFNHMYVRPPKRRIYVIKNGKLAPEYKPVEGRSLSIAARSLVTLTKYQSAGDLFRIHAMAKRDKAEFRLTAIPPSFSRIPKHVFDRGYMRALYKTAFDMGKVGTPWLRTPGPRRSPATGQRKAQVR